MILQLSDAIREEDCCGLIAIFDQNAHRASHADSFGNAILYPHELASLPYAISVLQRVAADCAKTIVERFQLPVALYPETVVLTKLGPGGFHPPHADNCLQDSLGNWLPNHTPNRHFSAIYYLNGNFGGGDIVFQRQALAINPLQGLLVAFPSDQHHLHEVRPVRCGARYTFPVWLTRDQGSALKGFEP
jgi:2OG-Fe(II) oxygenase superfamily